MDLLERIALELRCDNPLILGFGREGRSTYALFRRIFPSAMVTVADRNAENPSLEILRNDPHCRIRTGAEYLRNLDEFDRIVRSPGVPCSEFDFDTHRHKITSQTDLFLKLCPGTVIGVTGTKGKSTCSTLIASIFKIHSPHMLLLGNIGLPALDTLEQTTRSSLVVYELSSHQLVDVRTSPHIGILLNLYPEHLDYYPDMESYARAKANIARFSTPDDFLIYNSSFPFFREVARATPARTVPFCLEGDADGPLRVEGDRIVMMLRGKCVPVLSLSEIPLPGRFNLNNVLPAILAAALLDVSSGDIRKGVRQFRPLSHRIEHVATYKGISFYDDSISTIPESTEAALEVFPGRVGSLILGGYNRNLDFRSLARTIHRHRIPVLILFPVTGHQIRTAVEAERPQEGPLPEMFLVDSMEKAVQTAYARTEPGKVCLLSPASPSFNLFRDFEERGALFHECVHRLAGGKQRGCSSGLRGPAGP